MFEQKISLKEAIFGDLWTVKSPQTTRHRLNPTVDLQVRQSETRRTLSPVLSGVEDSALNMIPEF